MGAIQTNCLHSFPCTASYTKLSSQFAVQNYVLAALLHSIHSFIFSSSYISTLKHLNWKQTSTDETVVKFH